MAGLSKTRPLSASPPLTVDAITHAHHELLGDDQQEGEYAGLLDDLAAFAYRTDMATITQAAIVHTRFETIHPFTDAKGRIGRARLNAILRNRGFTGRVVVPVASVALAEANHYFAQLDAYHEGDIGSLVPTSLPAWSQGPLRS